MHPTPDIAARLRDPALARLLGALSGGKALTARELAVEAGLAPPDARAHLARLEADGLLRRHHGRHDYFALADDAVAGALRDHVPRDGTGPRRTRTGPRDARLRAARLCYTHLAGHRGTWMFDSLVAQGHLSLANGAPELTRSGADFVRALQIDVDALRTPLCRACLDWSERRPHLAGSLGRALLARFQALSWVDCDRRTRVVTFSSDGIAAFGRLFPAV